MIDKITDVTKTIIGDFDVLAKIKDKTDSGLILPTQKDDKGLFLYATITSVGKQIKDLKEGDIVLEYVRAPGMFEWKGDKYAITNRSNISLAINPEYFDTSSKKPINTDITC